MSDTKAPAPAQVPQSDIQKKTATAMNLASQLVPLLGEMATSAESDIATHATVLQIAKDVTAPAVQSLNVIANSGAVGHNDAKNLSAAAQTIVTAAQNADVAVEAATLVTAHVGWLQRFEALIAKIF